MFRLESGQSPILGDIVLELLDLVQQAGYRVVEMLFHLVEF